MGSVKSAKPSGENLTLSDQVSLRKESLAVYQFLHFTQKYSAFYINLAMHYFVLFLFALFLI